MAKELDPLSKLRDQVQATVSGSPAVKAVMGVRSRNVGEVGHDTNTEADVPRIILEPTGGPANINASSNLVQMTYAYNVLIDSGNQSTNAMAHPLLWALLATIATALPASGLTALVWRGKSFVKTIAVSQTTVGAANPLLNLGTSGKQAICTLTFGLAFDKTDLKNYAEGN